MNTSAVRAQESLPTNEGPSLVYFWGPVRSHVNRVALEYARRLHQSPVWVHVPDGSGDPAASELGPGQFSGTVYALDATDDVDAPTEPVPAREPLVEAVKERGLEVEVGRYLRYPAAVRAALRALGKRQGPTVLLITNIDHLGHLPLFADIGRSGALLRTMRSRGITVVVTSQGLIHAPALPMECAFRVESDATDPWSAAELWPGVPVSCCSTCGGSPTGEYGTCSPRLRSVCPLLIPFAHDGIVGEPIRS